ncbi:MAG: hypothetical protein L0226_07970 [Acidobacteria bacterium]|nr:hypothetical protein [Acidobacteriota bacterium]
MPSAERNCDCGLRLADWGLRIDVQQPFQVAVVSSMVTSVSQQQPGKVAVHQSAIPNPQAAIRNRIRPSSLPQ